MTKKLTSASVALALTMLGSGAIAQQFQPETSALPSTIQVIQPEIEVLSRPVIIEVQVDPDLGTDTSMRILCATTIFRGEVHEERQDTTISFSVSGEIRELPEGKFLISFDAQAESQGVSGGRGFGGSGAAVLEPGKPKSVLTIGGRSLFLTVRFLPEDSGAAIQVR